MEDYRAEYLKKYKESGISAEEIAKNVNEMVAYTKLSEKIEQLHQEIKLTAKEAHEIRLNFLKERGRK